MFRMRKRVARLVLPVFLAAMAAGCGATSWQWEHRVRDCREAKIGQTKRATVEASFGRPALTIYEVRDGRRVVHEGWLSHRAAMTFDVATGMLMAKGCL
jgi:hypothetical protein